MKKIALYTHSMQGGGTEKVFLILANYFVSLGYKVDLLLTLNNGANIALLDRKVSIYGLSGKRSIYDLPKLIAYLNTNKPDIILSGLTHINIINVIGSLISKKNHKIFVSEHSNFTQTSQVLNSIKLFVIKNLMKFLYKRVDGIICVSKGVQHDIIRYFPSYKQKIITIYNPFETAVIQQKSQKPINHPWLMPNREFKTIISAGRLNIAKDFKTLLKSFLLVKNHINARLVILGEGELKKELTAFIEQNDLQESVDLYGFVDNPFAYISKADLFVLSSKYEGLSNVLIESMICGVPLVSTDCPSGPAEILEHGKWGKLVPVGDSKALAQAIIQTLSVDTHLDYGERIQSFDYKKIGDDYLRFMLAN